MARRVLVAGGTGFIGGHVARALAAAGDDVVCLGRGARAAPAGETRVADRDDAAAMARALANERFDATLDFSGYTGAHVDTLFAVPGFVPGRYVFASTGQVCLVGTSRSMPYREADADTPLIPEPPRDTRDHGQWTYGRGKREAEAAIARARGRGVETLVLRLPVIQGDGDPSLRLWAYIERLLDGGPLLLPDAGEQRVRFLWVEDLVRAVTRVLERWPLPGPVYHVAQPDILAVREVVEWLARSLGVTPELVPVRYDDLAVAGLGPECSAYTGPWVSVLDPALAVREWGFTATPLAEYLDAVVRAHLEHRPAESHWGYARRPLERVLARRLKSGVG